MAFKQRTLERDNILSWFKSKQLDLFPESFAEAKDAKSHFDTSPADIQIVFVTSLQCEKGSQNQARPGVGYPYERELHAGVVVHDTINHEGYFYEPLNKRANAFYPKDAPQLPFAVKELFLELGLGKGDEIKIIRGPQKKGSSECIMHAADFANTIGQLGLKGNGLRKAKVQMSITL